MDRQKIGPGRQKRHQTLDFRLSTFDLVLVIKLSTDFHHKHPHIAATVTATVEGVDVPLSRLGDGPTYLT